MTTLCPFSHSLSCLKTYLGLLTLSAMQLNVGLHGLDHVPSIENCLLGSLSSGWIVCETKNQ